YFSSLGYSISAIRALRHGSYSIESTVASTPSRFRLKSMTRYIRLWPPPRNRLVVTPWTLRPPFFLSGLSSDFSGALTRGLVQSAKSDTIPPRRPADVGLYCLIPIGLRPSGVRSQESGVSQTRARRFASFLAPVS